MGDLARHSRRRSTGILDSNERWIRVGQDDGNNSILMTGRWFKVRQNSPEGVRQTNGQYPRLKMDGAKRRVKIVYREDPLN